MPIYEFECEECGTRFEELLQVVDSPSPACSRCGSPRTRRRLSTVAPPSRQPRGAGVRSGESQRRETEAARQERLSQTKRLRESGGVPPPRKSGGKE
jgi:putative FmdB family regulatory protein